MFSGVINIMCILLKDYTHEYVQILSKSYLFMGREKGEREQGRLRVRYEIRVLLWVFQGLAVLLEMSHDTVTHFSRRNAFKPLCHTKAEGIHGRDGSG